MELERTANIAFMVLLMVPVALLVVFLNIIVFREMNLNKRSGKKASLPQRKSVNRGKLSKFHSGKRRPQDR